MHTLLMTGGGLALLGVVLAVLATGGLIRSSRAVARAAGAFALVWLVVSAANFARGLAAGYSLGTEILAHLAVFGVPILAAIAAAKWAARHDPARPH